MLSHGATRDWQASRVNIWLGLLLPVQCMLFRTNGLPKNCISVVLRYRPTSSWIVRPGHLYTLRNIRSVEIGQLLKHVADISCFHAGNR